MAWQRVAHALILDGPRALVADLPKGFNLVTAAIGSVNPHPPQRHAETIRAPGKMAFAIDLLPYYDSIELNFTGAPCPGPHASWI
jgi:hypothetical protein